MCQKIAEVTFMVLRFGRKKFLISIRVITLLIIVSLFGILLKMDLWSQPDILIKDEKYLQQRKALANSSVQRSPSSVGNKEIIKNNWSAQEIAKDEELNLRLLTMDWDCSSKNHSFRVNNVGQLRLNGSCLKNAKRIINNSNGYSANIFKLKDNATTDYLSLNLGSNTLQFDWSDGASGNSTKSLEIIVEKQ